MDPYKVKLEDSKSSTECSKQDGSVCSVFNFISELKRTEDLCCSIPTSSANQLQVLDSLGRLELTVTQTKSAVKQYKNKKVSDLTKFQSSFKSFAEVNFKPIDGKRNEFEKVNLFEKSQMSLKSKDQFDINLIDSDSESSHFLTHNSKICNEKEMPSTCFLFNDLTLERIQVEKQQEKTSLLSANLQIQTNPNGLSSDRGCINSEKIKDPADEHIIEHRKFIDPESLQTDENCVDEYFLVCDDGTVYNEGHQEIITKLSVVPKVGMLKSFDNNVKVKKNSHVDNSISSIENQGNTAILFIVTTDDTLKSLETNIQKKENLNTHNPSCANEVGLSMGDKMRDSHLIQNLEFSCSQCDITFSNKWHRKNHFLRLHFENLQCNTCKKQFKSIFNFEKHLERNSCVLKKLKCYKCHLQCNSKEELKLHIKSHKLEKRFACHHCSEVFTARSSLSKHILVHTGKKLYSCSICQGKFTNVSTLDTHLRRNHCDEYPKYECSMCGKSFNSKFMLKHHITAHFTEGNPFSCKVCSKSFKMAVSLKNHLRQHRKEKRFQCDKCGKRFLLKKRLENHMRVHTGEKPFECAHCSKRFALRVNLQRHLQLHTETEQFHCKMCNKGYFQKQSLDNHIKSQLCNKSNYVQLNKSNTCSICLLPVNGSLRIHREEHKRKGEKPPPTRKALYKKQQQQVCQCHICGKIISNRTYLSYHLNSHRNTRPYKCSVCKAGFASQSNMYRHCHLHKGKQYVCNACGREFSQYQGLYYHMRTHTGAKPYNCLLCKRSFIDIRSQKRHMKLHEEERLHECADCGMCFYHKISLINHIQSHHATKI